MKQWESFLKLNIIRLVHPINRISIVSLSKEESTSSEARRLTTKKNLITQIPLVLTETEKKQENQNILIKII